MVAINDHLRDFARESHEIPARLGAGEPRNLLAEDALSFDDWLEFALAILQMIRGADERLKRQTSSGVIALQKRKVEEINSMYEQWFSACDALLAAIDQFQQAGFHLENAERFRAACNWSPWPGMEPDALEKAAQDIGRGAGVRLWGRVDAVRP